MKLIFVSPSFYPAIYYGGPVYSTYQLVKTLKKSGIDISVITTNAYGKKRLRIKTGVFHKLENDLPVKYYNTLDSRGSSISMLFNLKNEIKKADIVYLIAIFSPPTPFVIHLCKKLNKPLIISPRGQLGKWCLEQGNRFKKLWLRLFIQPICHPEPVEGQSSNHYVSWHLTSSAEEQDVLSVYPSARTFVIPNGVSEELFSMNDKKKDKSFYNKYTGFDCSNKKIIISMGRLQKVKGFDILIEAIGMIEEKKKQDWMIDQIGRPDVIHLIAGEDFGERKNLENLIDKLGLKEKVFLVGMIEGKEKVEFLRNADVFALASHHENFGIVYAEALAGGTPVVASRHTPWQEVEKFNCGRWVENSPEKFAVAINALLYSDLQLLGNNGIRLVKENYDWEKIADEFINKVNSIMN